MEPAGREPVHLLDAVVHRVEAPQERHRVREPVTPVAAEEHDRERERDRRGCGEHPLQIEAPDPEQRDGRNRDERDRGAGDEEVVREQVGEVGHEAPAQHLLGPEREELLDGHEEQEQHRDADDPVRPGEERDHEGCDEGEADDDSGTTRSDRLHRPILARSGQGVITEL